MNWTVDPVRRLEGEIVVPGDKSISHRAVLFASIATGETALSGIADGEDVAASAAAMASLGVDLTLERDSLRVAGAGLHGLRPPSDAIDCGNSGTTMRLLAGLLAGQPFASTLSGDRSLRRRPMRRIAEPLLAMGAKVATTPGGTSPLEIEGSDRLRAITFRPEAASAQVKSCVLLAGLYADGPTTVAEAARTRDHTERMLEAMGAAVWSVAEGDGARATIEPGPELCPLDGRVPGDISSAAYWLAAATLLPGSRLTLPGLGLNPGRAAIVGLLQRWGARIEVSPAGEWFGEPVGDLVVQGLDVPLTGGAVRPEDVPGLIDELPLVAALGAGSRDGVEIRGAAELRVKESDRIATTAAALRALGVEVDEFPDGLAVAGDQRLGAGAVDAAGDHRIALAFAAAGLAAAGPVTIENAEAMAVSYPGFAAALEEAAER